MARVTFPSDTNRQQFETDLDEMGIPFLSDGLTVEFEDDENLLDLADTWGGEAENEES